jgi:uncharacterized protein YkwD
VKVAALLGACVLVVALAPGASASLHTERHYLRASVNVTRERVGVHRVHRGHRWTVYAQRQARRMAREGYLWHSTPQLPAGSCWGEIVGVGGSVGAVYRAFLRSKVHLDVIRWGCPRIAGVGIVHRHGVVWVAIEFFRRFA